MHEVRIILMSKTKFGPEKSPTPALNNDSQSQSQSSSEDVSEEASWEIVEIIEESDVQYLVNWAGVNPKTNSPWAPEWVDKVSCNAPILVKQWRQKNAKAKSGQTKQKKAKATKRKSTKRITESLPSQSDEDEEPSGR